MTEEQHLISIEEISPNVKCVSEYTAKPEFYMPPRILYDHLIEYIAEGKGRYTIDEKEFQVSQGDVVLIPPGSVHSIRADREAPFTRQCAHFDFTFVGGYTSKPLWEWFPGKLKKDTIHPPLVFVRDFHLPTVSHLFDSPKCRSLFLQLFQEMYQKTQGYEIAVKAYILEILLIIHRNAPGLNLNTPFEPVAVLPEKIIHAKRYIEINYARKLTLKELADASYCHPVHLERLFKRFMSFSPMGYLLEVRIVKAKEYLEHSEFNITQIAEKIGFDSLQYFGCVFKRSAGTSPRDYRKMIHESGRGAHLQRNSVKDYPTHQLFSHSIALERGSL